MASSSGVPYVGSRISLISKAQIRYEGLLYSVNREESTIALSKVQSFGTEQRPAKQHVPPRQEVYEFIIFKADDIAELTVNEPPPLEDPAIVSMSTTRQPVGDTSAASRSTRSPSPVDRRGFRRPPTYRNNVPPLMQMYNTQPPFGVGHAHRNGNQQNMYNSYNQQGWQGRGGGVPQQFQANNSYHSNRGNQQRGPVAGRAALSRANRGRGAAGRPPSEKLKFETDFDFETANENFEKAVKLVSEGVEKLDVDDMGSDGVQDLDKTSEVFYDKATSFFDSISCEASDSRDWKKEREHNTDTFGETSVRMNNAQRGRWRRRGARGGNNGGTYRTFASNRT